MSDLPSQNEGELQGLEDQHFEETLGGETYEAVDEDLVNDLIEEYEGPFARRPSDDYVVVETFLTPIGEDNVPEAELRKADMWNAWYEEGTFWAIIRCFLSLFDCLF